MQANGINGIKILFVDDEPLNAQIFELNFADKYTILTASSGLEALEIFTRNPDVAIILSDHRMPGMSGVELLSRIYQLNPDTIRIIVTAYAEIGNLLDAINCGHIYHYVLKPWEPSQLTIILEQGSKIYNLTAENKRLITEQREMHEQLQQLSLHLIHAQEDERRRISMDLHDDIGQNLIALKMQFDNYCSQPGGRNDTEAEETRAIFRKTMRHTIDRTRTLCERLSPTYVEQLGLDQAINCFVNEFCRDYQFTFSGEDVRIEQYLSKPDQHQVYRILQEVFNNIGKHSATDHVSMATDVNDTVLSLTIRDFGRGFNTAKSSMLQPANSGRGFTTIQARATLLGGRVEIISKLRQGTTVTLQLPVNRPAVSN